MVSTGSRRGDQKPGVTRSTVRACSTGLDSTSPSQVAKKVALGGQRVHRAESQSPDRDPFRRGLTRNPERDQGSRTAPRWSPPQNRDRAPLRPAARNRLKSQPESEKARPRRAGSSPVNRRARWLRESEIWLRPRDSNPCLFSKQSTRMVPSMEQTSAALRGLAAIYPAPRRFALLGPALRARGAGAGP